MCYWWEYRNGKNYNTKCKNLYLIIKEFLWWRIVSCFLFTTRILTSDNEEVLRQKQFMKSDKCAHCLTYSNNILFLPHPMPARLSERLAPRFTRFPGSAALSQRWLRGHSGRGAGGCRPKGISRCSCALGDLQRSLGCCFLMPYVVVTCTTGDSRPDRNERLGDSKCCGKCCLLLIGWWIINSVLETITRELYRYREDKNMCQGLTSAYRKLILRTLNEEGLVWLLPCIFVNWILKPHNGDQLVLEYTNCHHLY